MRRRLAAALAVFALAAASVPAAYGAEDDQDRTVLYEEPNAVTIPYLDDVEAQPAEGWRFVDCPAVMAQSALVVSCDEERFTARADFYDPAYGHEVIDVASFEEGLEAIAAGSFSFVMTDIFMEGMGGIAGIKILKEKFPKLPVVAISGGWAELDPDDAIAAARKIGADAGVRKPISAIDFDAALRQIGRGTPVSGLS